MYGVWHTKGVGGGEGVVYCAIVVQSYCNSVGNAGGLGWGGRGGDDSCTKDSAYKNIL